MNFSARNNQRELTERAIYGLVCLIGAATSAVAGSIPAVPTMLSVEEITSRLARTEEQKNNNLREYSVTRRYVLRNSHLEKEAVLTARVWYRKGEGKGFEISDSSTAEGVSRRVLERVLKAEVEATHSNGNEEGSLTSDHYDFDLAGTAELRGRRCYILTLNPKQKSKYLLKGKAWVDAEDFALMRIEGRPAANLSFWVGKPYIMQNFQKIGDFWMATVNKSLSESHLLGKSELTVECSGYELRRAGDGSLAMRRGKQPAGLIE